MESGRIEDFKAKIPQPSLPHFQLPSRKRLGVSWAPAAANLQGEGFEARGAGFGGSGESPCNPETPLREAPGGPGSSWYLLE